ncbi:MAG: hypothetical protein KDA51_03425 [Planctomycetales bacterium]|nr:hypothetical protein [Planctomycetales bacterium]
MAIQYPFRNALYLPLGLMCAVTPLAMGCSGLQGRRSPMPVNPQFHENAGFCETSWRPLVGGSMDPRQSLEAPVEYTLPPIIDSGEVPLTAPVRHRRPVNPGAKPLHSRQYSAQSSVRHAAGARPVATQIPQGKRYRVRDHSHDAEQRDAEGSLLDYYAP